MRASARLAASAALFIALAGAGRATPTAPIVVVEQAGGLVRASSTLPPPPTALVASDGRLIVPGAQVALFPPPALRGLFERTLTPSGIAHLRALARAARLDRPPPDYGLPSIKDAAYTVVTYRASDGRTYVHRAVGLGQDVAGRDAEAARTRLRRFVAALRDPATFGAEEIGPERPYRPPAFELVARSAGTSAPEASQPVRPWPVASVRLAQAAACTPVTGPDAARLRKALASASTLTRWRQAGALYVVTARQVLPDDVPCR